MHMHVLHSNRALKYAGTIAVSQVQAEGSIILGDEHAGSNRLYEAGALFLVRDRGASALRRQSRSATELRHHLCQNTHIAVAE